MTFQNFRERNLEKPLILEILEILNKKFQLKIIFRKYLYFFFFRQINFLKDSFNFFLKAN